MKEGRAHETDHYKQLSTKVKDHDKKLAREGITLDEQVQLQQGKLNVLTQMVGYLYAALSQGQGEDTAEQDEKDASNRKPRNEVVEE